MKKYNTVITHGKPTQRGKHAQEVEIQQKCNFLAGLFRRLTLIRSVIKRQRKIVYQHFKDYKELLFAKSSKKCNEENF